MQAQAESGEIGDLTPAAGSGGSPRARRAAPIRGRLGAAARAAVAGVADPGAALVRAQIDLILWAPVALSVGIGAYFLWPGEPGVLASATPAALALLAGAIWARGGALGLEPARFPAALLMLALCGGMLAGARAHSVSAPVLSFRYYGPVEGRVVKVDRSASDRLRLTLDQPVLNGVAPARMPARLRVSLHGDQSHLDPVPGVRVMMTANLSPPPPPAEPGSYDFRRHFWFDRLGAVGYTRAPVMVMAPPDPGHWALAGHRLRMRLSQAIQARIPGQAGAVAAALMTGDRAGITEATNAAMRAANLAHIIAISGLHMGLLAGFVFAAVRYGLAALGRPALIWPVKKIAAIVALLAATAYLWIAGPQVATQRAYLMTGVMLLAVLFDRRAISLRTVALAALILLVWQPESLLSPGFQMSFAATVALIVTYARWGQVAPRIPALLRPVVMLVLTSLVAGLATGPIAAAQFHRMPEYGLLANLLAVPVMGTLVMPAGVIAALLAPLGLAAPALWVMELGTRWMIFVAQWVAGLEGAVIAVPQPPEFALPVLACGALVAVLARGAARSLGGVAMGVAVLGWAMAPRPFVLIAPEAVLVGVMTPTGRALSKPAASFIAESWLEADGDGATRDEAAARRGFAGPKNARVAQLPDGRALVHLSGKGAADRLAEYCHSGALVVLAAKAPPDDSRRCDLWDETRLTDTGAVSIATDGRVRTSADVTGARLWSKP
ncbi:MAG: ComEC/Rec2 family competence protein [Paracoccaceae bacterium]|nr:ComEC/Rec2 family competence protein [Paracoccaceae bacterium]